MADRFGVYSDNVSAPGTYVQTVSPSDSADLTDIPKGIYVGTGGDIAMIGTGASASATATVWRNVPSGALIPFRPRRILATGTTAADMLAVY